MIKLKKCVLKFAVFDEEYIVSRGSVSQENLQKFTEMMMNFDKLLLDIEIVLMSFRASLNGAQERHRLSLAFFGLFYLHLSGADIQAGWQSGKIVTLCLIETAAVERLTVDNLFKNIKKMFGSFFGRKSLERTTFENIIGSELYLQK